MPAFAFQNKQAILGSKHDLGVTGGGGVVSAASNSCIFCHAPHNVLAMVTPLWDHELSGQLYTNYTSSTYNSGSQAPSAGSSKLCLSCHDGTVAVGFTVAQGLIPTSGTMEPENILGSNLSSDHPVGMTPVDDGQLAASMFTTPPSSNDPAVKLVSGKVECVTCHDPHVPNNDPILPRFLSRSNVNGALCLSCHDPTRAQPNALNGWYGGAHATATNILTSSVENYSTVSAKACSSCHGAHKNPAGARNLTGVEQDTCSPCHSGTNISPPLLNVFEVLSKPYSHPINTVTGVHDPVESIPVNTARHAECADCHNPHAAAVQVGTALPPVVPAALAGVSGYEISSVQLPAIKEYQVCFKCHADSTNKPQNSAYMAYGRTPGRYPQGPMPAGYPIPPPMPSDQYNVRLQFMSAIGHNVMGNSIVTTSNTSLRTYMLNVDGTQNTSRPLTTTSQIYCTDCHNNDQARSFNGTGPNGPHGSSFQHLLQLNLYLEPIGGGSGNTSSGKALCNKCHNLSNLGNIHRDHHNNFGCVTCHDPHGVIGGNAASNRAMINFDTAIVSPTSAYFGYFYNGSGSGQKGCYVRCHGDSHNPETY